MAEPTTPAAEEAPKSAYVPPHLRARGPSEPTPSGVPYKFPQQYFSSREIGQHYGAPQAGTLNASINNPKEIAYILIFINQHPQYPPKIFVKSNLELIFKDAYQGDAINPSLENLEFPVFEEHKKGSFRFKTWAKLKEAKRLVKGTDELIDMLTEKWKRDTPRRGGWERERERERSKNGPDAKVTKSIVAGPNGVQVVTETVVFANDDDDDNTSPTTSMPVAQKLENTRPRSQSAWKTSLGVDWGVVTLDFIGTEKGNPLHGLPIKLIAQPKPFDDRNIENLVESTGAISVEEIEPKDRVGKTKGEGSGSKGEFVSLSKALQMDGADDTMLVNDDCDAASIPSSPILGPVTPKIGSTLNLSAYGLAQSTQPKPSAATTPAYEMSNSQSDISQSYISTDMGESVVEDFGTVSAASETDADESDRWSEVSDHDKPEDTQWMAIERNGVAKEVY